MAKIGNQNALGNKGGRPEEYKPEFIQEVDKYLETCKDKVVQGRIIVNLPMMSGFAEWLDVNDDTLVKWRKKYPEFNATCKRIERKQQKRLMNQGLSGNYNSTIAKLILAANHGMSDKIENTVKGGLSLTQLLKDAKEPDEKEDD